MGQFEPSSIAPVRSPRAPGSGLLPIYPTSRGALVSKAVQLMLKPIDLCALVVRVR
jgi:hypothetical protein